MLGKSILVATEDRPGGRRLGTSLRAAGNDVVRPETSLAACELIEAGAVDLVLLDCDAMPAFHEVLEAARGRVPVVAMSAAEDPAPLLDLVCDRGVDHLLTRTVPSDDAGGHGAASRVDTREVVVTAEKILRDDMFGLDKYLPSFGVEHAEFDVGSSDDRSRVVRYVKDYVTSLGAGNGLAGTMALVADELITNAIYNAPVDAQGVSRYRHVDRRRGLELDPWERVRVELASDGRCFALSVTDFFGSLDAESIRTGLERCLTSDDPIIQAQGGAGLGLYMVMASCNQLVLNVDPGVRTEAIAMVDVTDRMRGAKTSGRSLHLFLARGTESPSLADGVPESVLVSDSMRLDICSTLASVKRAPSSSGKRCGDKVLTSRPRAGERGLGDLLPAVSETIGIDTACGLLHGAVRRDEAIEIALRYLGGYYAGGVVYAVDEGALTPWFAIGGVNDWSRARSMVVPLDDRSSLARLVTRGVVAAFRPTASPTDHRIARVTAGQTASRALVLPIRVGGDVRYALYMFIPRFDRLLGPRAVEALKSELEVCLGRLDSEAVDYESIELSAAQ